MCLLTMDLSASLKPSINLCVLDGCVREISYFVFAELLVNALYRI